MNKVLKRIGWCWHDWSRWSEPFQGKWEGRPYLMTQRRKCLKCDAIKYRTCT